MVRGWVFLSSATTDLLSPEYVVLHDHLQVWTKRRVIRHGDADGRHLAGRLSSLIRSTDCLVLYATQNALASRWCRWEVGVAMALGIPVLVFKAATVPGHELGEALPMLSGDLWHPELDGLRRAVASALRDRWVARSVTRLKYLFGVLILMASCAVAGWFAGADAPCPPTPTVLCAREGDRFRSSQPAIEAEPGSLTDEFESICRMSEPGVPHTGWRTGDTVTKLWWKPDAASGGHDRLEWGLAVMHNVGDNGAGTRKYHVECACDPATYRDR